MSLNATDIDTGTHVYTMYHVEYKLLKCLHLGELKRDDTNYDPMMYMYRCTCTMIYVSLNLNMLKLSIYYLHVIYNTCYSSIVL